MITPQDGVQFTVALQLRRKLYDAVVGAAGGDLDSFCSRVCIPALADYGQWFRMEGYDAGKALRARFLANGRDITAVLVVDQNLYRSLFERAKDGQFSRNPRILQLEIEKTCRDVCRGALAEEVGVEVVPTMGEP